MSMKMNERVDEYTNINKINKFVIIIVVLDPS